MQSTENEELYQFLACDYFATGEGRTVMLLITRAYPHADDYETPGDADTDNNYQINVYHARYYWVFK